jgi:uncharacterized membrane protein YfcA
VVLVGILAGIVPGLFGGGGGWLLVPLMVLCLGVPWGFASGTVLCAFLSGVTAGVVSVAMAGRAGRQVHTPGEDRVTVVMTAAGVVGAILGKAVLRDWLDGFDWATTVLDSILIAALLVIAGRLFYEVAVGFEPERPKKPRRRHLVMIGLVSLVPGMLSGLIGIGGGILYVPILLCVLHWRPDEARNAARICVLASSVVAVVLYAMSGGVHFPTAAGMFIPAGIAGVVTSSVKFSDSEKRRRVFKVLAGSMASLAIVLTVIHMMRGSEPRVEPGKGSLAMAALVVLVPSAWGVLCAQAQRAIVKRISGRARPAELYDGLD